MNYFLVLNSLLLVEEVYYVLVVNIVDIADIVILNHMVLNNIYILFVRYYFYYFYVKILYRFKRFQHKMNSIFAAFVLLMFDKVLLRVLIYVAKKLWRGVWLKKQWGFFSSLYIHFFVARYSHLMYINKCNNVTYYIFLHFYFCLFIL